MDQINIHEVDIFDKNPEYIISLLNDIKNSNTFFNYQKKELKNFSEDKVFVIKLFKQIIAYDNKLYDFFEDREISWVNDLPLVNSLVLISLKKINKLSRKSSLFTKLYKNNQDAEFGIKLIKEVVLKQDILKKEINKFTSNWDNERIAQIDLILLQMCLAEFLFFDSIPLKVSINEYLEIAKEYSSPKSNIFINGVMDAVSKELIADGRIKKNKRGLQ